MTTNLKTIGMGKETGCTWLPPVFSKTLGIDIQIDTNSYDKDSKTIKYTAKQQGNDVEGFISVERLPAFFRADSRYDIIMSTGLETQKATAGKHSHVSFLDKAGNGITNWVEDHLHFIFGKNISPFVRDKHTHKLLTELTNEEYNALPEDARIFHDVTNTITVEDDPILATATDAAAVARTGGEITKPQLDTRPFSETLAEALQRGLTAGKILKEQGAKNIKISTKITHKTGLLDTTITYTPKEEI